MLITLIPLAVCKGEGTCEVDTGNGHLTGRCRSKCTVWENEASSGCGPHCKCCLPLVDGKNICRLGNKADDILMTENKK